VGSREARSACFRGLHRADRCGLYSHRRSRDWLRGGAFDSSAREEANISVAAQVMEQSQIEVGVQGHGNANRLFLCTGRVQFQLPGNDRFGFSLARPSFMRNSSRRAPPPGSRCSPMAARPKPAQGLDSK
jgi:hypothetical protein